MLAIVFLAVLPCFVASVSGHAHDSPHHAHDHVARGLRLPRNQVRSAEKEAELHRMFKRQSTTYPSEPLLRVVRSVLILILLHQRPTSPDRIRNGRG
jgi:hypothetical protein